MTTIWGDEAGHPHILPFFLAPCRLINNERRACETLSFNRHYSMDIALLDQAALHKDREHALALPPTSETRMRFLLAWFLPESFEMPWPLPAAEYGVLRRIYTRHRIDRVVPLVRALWWQRVVQARSIRRSYATQSVRCLSCVSHA